MPAKPPLRFVTPFGAYTAQRSDTLGQGGAGRVYRAVEEGADATVAVKVLDPAKAASREKARRFKNEILFGQRAGHNNVLSVSDYGSVVIGGAETSFYVMPLYDKTLRGLLKEGIPPDRVVPLFGGLLDGVEAAHRQDVVHRDLKPENVLYDAVSDALVVADFGIARFTDADLYTLVETGPRDRLANFEYAAPEQRAPGREVGVAADVYALGLILNEMFTGTVPLAVDHPTIAGAAPAYAVLDPLVAAMRQQSPTARPASVDAIRRRLPSSVFDPLVRDPVKIVDTDASVPHALVLVLNHAPTPKWKEVLGRLQVSCSNGYDPRRMSIVGDRVTIKADGQRRVSFDEVARSYKSCFEVMSEFYPRVLAEEAQSREAEARWAEQARADAERRRLEWNQALGI